MWTLSLLNFLQQMVHGRQNSAMHTVLEASLFFMEFLFLYSQALQLYNVVFTTIIYVLPLCVNQADWHICRSSFNVVQYIVHSSTSSLIASWRSSLEFALDITGVWLGVKNSSFSGGAVTVPFGNSGCDWLTIGGRYRTLVCYIFLRNFQFLKVSHCL